MEFCMNSRRSRSNRWTQLIFCCAACFLPLVYFRITPEPTSGDLASAVFCIALAFLLSAFIAACGIFLFVVQARRYRLSPDGILIRYPGGRTAEYAWKDAKSVILTDVCPSRDERDIDVVLRISFEDEPDLPIHTRFSSGKWRYAHHYIRHFQSVILIEYTPERMAEIKRLCGQEIIDLRSPICREMYPDKC